MNWKKIDQKEIIKNKHLTIVEDVVIQPNGKESTYVYTKKSDSVILIPFDGENIYFIEQYRYPINAILLQLPAGALDGKSIEETAKAELEEETGIQAEELTYLGSFFPFSPRQTSVTNVILATKLSKPKNEHIEGDESIIQTKKINVKTVENMLKENQFKCGETIASLCLFLAQKKST